MIRRLMTGVMPAALLVGFGAAAQDGPTAGIPKGYPAGEFDPTGQVATPDEIVVTAQGRRERLSRVPLAVTAVDARQLAQSGIHDLRELTQLTPSLFLASSSTEAAGAAARIRGIGTVGDNPGLESSVATFVDGVYRSRTGAALTELGPLDRVEVLRGPQGTLFGRNASAGLIAVFTAAPEFHDRGDASFTVGNYGERRAELGVTGPFGTSDSLAYRIDGVWTKRHGFLTDVVSGDHVNGRNRWLGRGQILWKPSDALSVRLIADWADRDEECCAGVYRPVANRTIDADGRVIESPSMIAGLIRSFGGHVEDDPFARKTAITPGQSYRADVRDRGLSLQGDLDLGWATLSSITAYRDYRWIRGQDADFNDLDLLVRPDNGDARERFGTWSQELRLNGKAFGNRLDWLVGGYLAAERLHLSDNLSYGSQFGEFFSCLVANGAGGIDRSAPGCLAPAARTSIGQTAAGQTLLAGLDRLAAISSAGAGLDRYRQHDTNAALFTHDVLHLTDRLSITAGLRYTRERKSLAADLNGSPVAAGTCLQNAASLAAVRDNPTIPAALRGASSSIIGFSCVIAPIASADLAQAKSEGQLSGTGVLSWQTTDRLLAYASWSRGYKAFGYNLDRAALSVAAPSADQLRYKAETVTAVEAGLKYHASAVDLDLALFEERFSNFQLNLFSGSNFIVANLGGCTELSGGAGSNADNVSGNSACVGHRRPGVISRGVEVNGALRPVADVRVDAGLTYARARYAEGLTAVDGSSLPIGFFGLPGHQVSSAPKWTATGAAGWTPPLGSALRGMVHAGVRYQSSEVPGSDLDPEKLQKAVAVVDARVGLGRFDGSWSVELWAENLFDANYIQVGFDAPAQPGGAFNTVRGVKGGYQAVATQLFGAFLAEPRTWGLTLRTRF